MTSLRLSHLTAIAAACLAGHAWSAEPVVKFSGFGTLGLTHSSAKNADFKGMFFDTATGAGRSDTWSFNPDSRLAVQMDAEYDTNWELTGQLMARKTYDKTFSPTVETFNLKYKFDNFTSLRAGRFAHPYFMVSDARVIGYAVPFVRGPVEVYGNSNLHTDGVQFSKRLSLADSSITTSFGVGEGKYDRAPSDATVSKSDSGAFRKLLFGDIQYETGPWTLRAGASTGKNDYAPARMKRLFDFAAMVDPALSHELDFNNKRVTFFGLGATWDTGDYFAQAEYTMVHWGLGKKSIAPDEDAFYFMAGKRIGNFSPYAIYAKKSSGTPRVVTEFAMPALNSAFTTVAKSVPTDQHTLSAGIRWDFKANMALKAQYDHMTMDSDGNNSMLINVDPNNPIKKGDSVNIIGVTLDFIF